MTGTHGTKAYSVSRNVLTLKKNYNALQNPFVQAIHVQQKALLSI